jgi:hypothetical protein
MGVLDSIEDSLDDVSDSTVLFAIAGASAVAAVVFAVVVRPGLATVPVVLGVGCALMGFARYRAGD